ncbi:MAG TPA: Uma2 family endonuclease [Nocardioides sp.]|jgi:Uma2 family endonuclease
MTLSRDDVVVRAGPFSRAERDALPDDGRRHELLDGVLLMTPAPSTRHQDIVARLFVALSAAAPRSAKVLIAPFDVALSPATVIEPDVVVARRIDVTDRDLPTAPLLAVEVLSPSTRLFDLGRKKELLEQAGCPSYWVIDPDGPELTALELRDGRYVEVARVSAMQTWTATAPYDVTIVPRDLLDDLLDD